MMLGGALAGGAWGFIPGILRARLGVNEIITSLMLNYVALSWIQYWVFGPWSEGGFQQTDPFPPEAWLPRLTDFAEAFPVLGGLTVHLGLVFGIVLAAIMWVALERTRWGYEIRLIGDNPRAARYAGIDIAKKIVIVFMISGALAGLGGMSEVTGVVHRLQDRISPGYGFTAIIIAYLARFGPFRVIVASILFGGLILAGREIQPSGVPAMVQGIVLFCLIGADVLVRYRIRLDRLTGDDLMDWTTILAAGVTSGTIILFAAIGEIFAERSGVLNLGVEGMMLIGAVAGFSTAASTGNPWLGVVVAMLAGGALSLLHGIMTIHLRADQVISGLALTFLGTGLARVLGEGLSSSGSRSLSSRSGRSRACRTCRSWGRSSSPGRASWPMSPTCSSRRRGSGSSAPARVSTCERSASRPAAADAQGIDVYRPATPTCSWEACWRASPGPRSPWPSHRAGSATRPSTGGAGSRSGW